MTDETVPSDIPTSRMLSWARNSTIYRLERRMMTEKQLFDAIARKAKEKFEDISAAQLKAVADFAVQFAYDNKVLDDSAYAEISTRSAVRGGKSKRAIAQKLAAKGVSSDKVEVALEEALCRSDFCPQTRLRPLPPGRARRKAKGERAFGFRPQRLQLRHRQDGLRHELRRRRRGHPCWPIFGASASALLIPA